MNHLVSLQNKTKVGDFGIDGHIFPGGAEPAAFKEGELQLTERWYPRNLSTHPGSDKRCVRSWKKPDVGAYHHCTS